MNVRNKLRNSLYRRLQELPQEKLSEINSLLDKIENHLKSKEITLKLAGSWQEIDESLFEELTDQLHSSRADDRKIPSLD